MINLIILGYIIFSYINNKQFNNKLLLTDKYSSHLITYWRCIIKFLILLVYLLY